ncbi:MAG: S1 RNA-binding domain-containing protein, partial [Clostridiales bacterium]|nr:S1 RNA-binding domain-containing protein [Clostridiales bacterium]
MELEVGAILDGKVTGITKFGAFVALPGGRSGLVHISEIAYSYVSDVSEFLSVGQDVRVKLISIDEGGHINLSIKKTAPPPPRPPHSAGPRPQGGRPASPPRHGGGRPRSEGG